MEIFITIFNETLYRPLFNALVFIYNIIPDLGIAIIVLTSIIRLILYPFSKKAVRSQKEISQLQPKIKEIQKKHPNKEEQARALMSLYQKHRINPMAGCLPILIQLPILIALYRVFFTGLDAHNFDLLYNFVQEPASFNVMFLNLVDLSQKSIIFAFLAGILQFFHSKMVMPKKGSSAQKGKVGGIDVSSILSSQMTYFMPLLTFFIALNLPAALPLYWSVITVFGIIQHRLTKVRTEAEA